MLSIFILFIQLIMCLMIMKRSQNYFSRYVVLGILSAVIVECVVYGYFLFLIFKGTCFFLIGNQTILDTLAKLRLSHAIYFSQGKKDFIYQVDSDLGYTIGKNKDTGTYKSNWQGLRANREYSLVPSPNVLRLAVFGDSFVFCDDEKNDNAWPYYLENSAGNLEVLNFGVSGYGMGQSYLRYLKDGLKFQPDIVFFNYVLIGSRDHIDPRNFVGENNLRGSSFYHAHFWIENNILLSEGITPYHLFDQSFRENYLYQPLGIPQRPIWSWKIFSISNTGLFLKNLALKRLVSERVKKFELKEGGEEISFKILQSLLETVQKNKSMVLFFNQPFGGLPERIRSLLLKYPDRVVYRVSSADIKASIERHGAVHENLYNTTNHYNARGNQLYADAVLEILKSQRWGEGNRVFEFNKEKNVFRNVSQVDSGE